MSRKPRKIYNVNFFHVIVQGINKEYIFKNKNYIEKYINTIQEFANELEVDIIAYCIMSNHAHFVIYTQSNENLSTLMRKTNTKFAQYYNFLENRVGYVFRDRFRSEPITNIRYLITCINYIHNNPVKANMVKICEEYKYSTYEQFIQGNKIEKLNKLLDENFDVKIFMNPPIQLINFDIDINEYEILDYSIYDFKCKKNITLNQIFEEKSIIIELIRFMKKQYKIPYNRIMEKLGVSRSIIKQVQYQ